MDGHALLMDFFLVTGININILMLYVLIKSRHKGQSQKLLIGCFFIFSFYILTFYAELHNIIWLERLSFVFTESATFLLAPLLYFYIKSLFVEIKFTRKLFIHFVPFTIHFLMVTVPFLISIWQRKFLFPYLKTISDYGITVSIFEDIYFVSYLLLSLRVFSRFQIALKANYSSLEEKDLGWSKRMLIGALVVLGINLSTSVYEIFRGNADWVAWTLTVLAMIILEGHLGYYGTRQTRIFIPDFLLKEEAPATNSIGKSPSSSHLANASAAEINDLKQRLQEVLKKNRPYLDDSLTLNTLAKMFPTTDKKLSALLNLHLNVSFYDLINQHRVEAVKEKLQSPEFEKYSLLGIALDSGFKSKTSFNRVFKKETGVSPSIFKAGVTKK